MMVDSVLNSKVQWRDWLGRGLMVLATLGALGAFFSGLMVIQSAGPETIWVETWRMFGFLVFTGMFALLAWRPHLSAGIWELAFFHKAAMAIASLVLSEANGAASAGMIDAVLAAMILLVYLLVRGWTAWKR
jgi:hypothetical protein